MKYSVKKLLGLLMVTGLAIAPSVSAMPANSAIMLAQMENPDPALEGQQLYWEDSVDLVQTQIDLLNQIGRSLYSPQRSEVQVSYRKLFFYTGELDRYLTKYGATAKTSCANSEISVMQLATYCAIWQSRNNLYTLLDTLKQRLSQLGNTEDTLLFPISNGAFLSSEIAPQEDRQNQENNGGLVITGAAKPARNAGNVLLPAIAPLPNTAALIANQKKNLLALQPILPAGYKLEDIDVFATTNTRYQYKPLPQEYQQYQTFLAQPHTGLSRLLPKDAYEETYTTSSLQPSLKEQYPFPQLNAPKPIPNLPLLVQNGELIFMPEALNINLITDLGETDFSTTQTIKTDHPLLTYQSPNTFQGLQQEQRKLIFQKSANEVAISAPLVLNHLYLVRLIQYEFSPEILAGKVLPRQRFQEINDLANPPSHDVLVEVKPVKNWLDGGYTLLWQVVDQKPATKIKDLANYITVNSPSQP